MSRVAGVLAPLLLLAAAASAAAADLSGSEVYGEKCLGRRVEIARYKEQICQRGVTGYAECRWVSREHEVEIPAACEPRDTVERSRPATRGAFPPFPYVAPRG
jgi:hypothetical protein